MYNFFPLVVINMLTIYSFIGISYSVKLADFTGDVGQKLLLYRVTTDRKYFCLSAEEWYTVECRFNVVHYIMILHTVIALSKDTPYLALTGELWGVCWKTITRIKTAPHCICVICWFCKCTTPWMFRSLDILPEYLIEHVSFGLLYIMFTFPTRIFYRGVPGFATDYPSGVWCRGLTTCPLYVGPLFGNLV